MPAPALPAITDSPDSTRRIFLGHRSYWLCQGAGWGGTVLLSAVLIFAAQSWKNPAARDDVFFTLTVCGAGLLATHGLRAVALRQRWVELPARRMWSRWVAWWLGLSLALSALTFRFTTTAPGEAPSAPLIACVMMNTMLLAGWITLYVLFHADRALQRSEVEKARLRAAGVESQLLALQTQMHPHFLFNSLNTIRALVPPDAAPARAAITTLADILRSSLVDGRETLVTLARELEITRAYLAMEKLRFEDALHITEEVPEALLSVRVPPLMLLTLVENAIKHGLLHAESGGRLGIHAAADAHGLTLCVTSPHLPASNTASEPSLGLGLHNVRERLHLIFGPDADLTLAEQAGTMRASIHLPIATP